MIDGKVSEIELVVDVMAPPSLSTFNNPPRRPCSVASRLDVGRSELLALVDGKAADSDVDVEAATPSIPSPRSKLAAIKGFPLAGTPLELLVLEGIVVIGAVEIGTPRRAIICSLGR